MLTIVCSTTVSTVVELQHSHMPKISNPIQHFGKRVREQRTALGFSQEKLAADAGVHRTYIGMVERAEKNITLENIAKIARALRVNIDELFR